MVVRVSLGMSLPCPDCEKRFSTPSNLRRHERISHGWNGDGGIARYVCGECQVVCSSHDAFERHIVELHSIAILPSERHKFSNEALFDAWKQNEEAARMSLFIKRSFHNLSSGGIKCLYRCSRDGKTTLKPPEERSRMVRHRGTCKINAHCPARFNTTVLPDGKVEVEYHPTHFGHDFKLSHLPLPSSVKAEVAAKINSNVPKQAILEEIRGRLDDIQIRREHLMTMQDIRNVERHLRNYGSKQYQTFNNVGTTSTMMKGEEDLTRPLLSSQEQNSEEQEEEMFSSMGENSGEQEEEIICSQENNFEPFKKKVLEEMESKFKVAANRCSTKVELRRLAESVETALEMFSKKIVLRFQDPQAQFTVIRNNKRSSSHIMDSQLQPSSSKQRRDDSLRTKDRTGLETV